MGLNHDVQFTGVNPPRSWDGDFVEVIIYNEALSTEDRQLVESYLMSKYGLS